MKKYNSPEYKFENVETNDVITASQGLFFEEDDTTGEKSATYEFSIGKLFSK